MDSEKFEDDFYNEIETEENVDDIEYYDLEDEDPEELNFEHF